MCKCNLTHGSLFSGAGDFELGARECDIDTLWNCEILPYQRKVLKKNFPNTIQYEDIRQVSYPPHVDIISGGFPCQDISTAGKGEGIKGARSGLWSEMYRVICEVRPKYIIAENSPALTFRGFERVLYDLAEIGYDAEWQCISNSDFGFPHQRERIYVIAYPTSCGQETDVQKHGDTCSTFREWSPNPRDGHSIAKGILEIRDSDVFRGNDRFPSWMDRVTCCGNAVNPIVAKYLFQCIKIREEKCSL